MHVMFVTAQRGTDIHSLSGRIGWGLPYITKELIIYQSLFN